MDSIVLTWNEFKNGIFMTRKFTQGGAESLKGNRYKQ
jgi:hypothetical protein